MGFMVGNTNKDYVNKLANGADGGLWNRCNGDMGCHLVEAPLIF
jgi:hypothetical protein